MSRAAALAALLALTACKKEPAPAPAGPAQAATAGQLSLSVPQEAVSEPASSPMRLGQWRLPKATDEAEDASLVVFGFAPGQGGTPEQNIQRWCAMYFDDSGKPACEQSKPTTRKLGDREVTEVSFRGRYKTSDMMSGQPVDKPGQAMLAAILVAPSGTYVVKLTGPERAVERQRAFFSQVLVPSLKAP